ESKSLTQLYDEAVREGGNLVVYHGGDTADQQDFVANAFRTAYPKVNLTMIVDYSKYHNVRIDNQLETNSLVADVVALQTLNDYPRWKRQGKLLAYKPAGFNKVFKGFTDPDGTWLSHAVFTFSYFYDEAVLKKHGLEPPATAKDLADPKYANLIASAYPHDDDATLFVYWRYVQEYGWDWVKKMAAQRIEFKRGSHTPDLAVTAQRKAIGVAGSAPATNSTTVKEITGKDAASDYLAWGQRMAILKKAPHPAAAKLFVNWIISKDVQSTVMGGFSSRTDLPPPSGVQPWDIKRANSLAFQTFMEDRAKVEELKATFALYFNEVTGEPSPGQLGLHPGK
ncbi:ABC transporter, partial [Achlya hypogyna]